MRVFEAVELIEKAYKLSPNEAHIIDSMGWAFFKTGQLDKAIAMLWMRGRLSFLEQLCIRSFQDAGHSVVLYSYDDLEGVPDGVECRSAASVLPERAEIVHGKSGSPAPHADLFR